MKFPLPSSSSLLLKVPDDETTAMTMMMYGNTNNNGYGKNDVRVITMLIMTINCAWLQIIVFEPNQFLLFFQQPPTDQLQTPCMCAKSMTLLGKLLKTWVSGNHVTAPKLTARKPGPFTKSPMKNQIQQQSLKQTTLFLEDSRTSLEVRTERNGKGGIKGFAYIWVK